MASFYVNGQAVSTDKNQKLLRFLRDELRLTSVKDGCSEGACGTCHVLIDGKATKACVPSTDKLEGKHIITVEGLSDTEKEVYAWAFAKAGAVQCGFCIPGMVISAKALLDVNPAPAREEVAFAIRNNICRCTGYKKIIDAILLAAELFRNGGELPLEKDSARVGEAMPRIDAREKVLGTGKYPDDIYLDGMIYGSAVRSKYPRARVLAIHKEKAEALPGVVGVYTADDIPGKVKVGHLMQDWDTMIPVGKITHYLGDAICLVAAETPEILEKAKKLVEVEYEPLKPVFSPTYAAQPFAPLVHESGNLLCEKHVSRGNADQAIRDADYVLMYHSVHFSLKLVDIRVCKTEIIGGTIDSKLHRRVFPLLRLQGLIAVCRIFRMIFHKTTRSIFCQHGKCLPLRGKFFHITARLWRIFCPSLIDQFKHHHH